MPISVDCDECGYSFNAADKFAGKLVRCPECSETIRVEGATPGSRSAQLRATRGSKKSTSAEARKTRPARKGSSRPSRPARRKRKKSSGNDNKVMIAGGATIVVLLGIIGFLMMRGDDAPEPDATDPANNRVASSESSRLIEQARLEDARKAEEAKRLAAARAESEKKVTKSTFAPGKAGGGLADTTKLTPSRPLSRPTGNAGHDSAANRSLTDTSGNRVAWLLSDGYGFAKKEDMWVYHGDPTALGLPSGRGPRTSLPFYETLRTDSFVELFNAEHYIRVRLMPNEFVSYYLPKKSKTPKRGGVFKSSTKDAGAWLSSFSLPTDRQQLTPLDGEVADLPDLIERVEKQVARIDVVTSEGSGNGSGFLVDESGRIVTNYHVVEGCTRARAVFKDAGADGKEVEVPIIGFLHVDPKRDIAVLQAVLPMGFKFRGLPLAKETRKGEGVVAFGAPLALDSTASEGIISGYRTAEELKDILGVDGHAGNWIQTTTPISPGNSGGPLVNRNGEVVAINTMTLTIGQQLNFAISAADIQHAIDVSTPTPRELTPKNLPIASHRASRAGSPGPTGRPSRSGKRIRIPVAGGYAYLWPIEGTPEAAKYLGEMEETLLEVVSRNTAIKTSISDSAREALSDSGIRVVIDEGPMLLVVPELSRATKNFDQLQLFAHLYVVRNGEALRIWRGSADLGRISQTLLRRGSLGTKMRGEVKSFFADLKKEIQDAKANPSQGSAGGDEKKDPFKDR